MHLSAADIATFKTAREVIVIGPRAAFGVQSDGLLVRERTSIRRIFDRLLLIEQAGPAVRPFLRRWGLDTSVATRQDRTFLPNWLTEQTMRGILAVTVAPEVTTSFAGVAGHQEQLSDKALKRMDKRLQKQLEEQALKIADKGAQRRAVEDAVKLAGGAGQRAASELARKLSDKGAQRRTAEAAQKIAGRGGQRLANEQARKLAGAGAQVGAQSVGLRQGREQAQKSAELAAQDDFLPSEIEDRFMIVLSMVPDHLEGKTRQEFLKLIEPEGAIAMLAAGLLMWIAAHFIPGVNVAVLVFDLWMLSGDVLRAMEVLAELIEDVRKARRRSDLDPIAAGVAAIIAVLIVNAALARLLKAKRPTKGPGKGDIGNSRKSKPDLEKKQARPTRKPQEPETKKAKPVDTVAKKPKPDDDAAAKKKPSDEGEQKKQKKEEVSPQVAAARQRQEQMLKDDKGFNITPNKTEERYDKIGRHGTFLTDQQAMDKALQGATERDGKLVISKQQARQAEKDLGLDQGSLDGGFKVREVTNLGEKGARSPLPAAGNAQFTKGGDHLPGGAPELVVDSISTKDTPTSRVIKEVVVE